MAGNVSNTQTPKDRWHWVPDPEASNDPKKLAEFKNIFHKTLPKGTVLYKNSEGDYGAFDNNNPDNETFYCVFAKPSGIFTLPVLKQGFEEAKESGEQCLFAGGVDINGDGVYEYDNASIARSDRPDLVNGGCEYKFLKNGY